MPGETNKQIRFRGIVLKGRRLLLLFFLSMIVNGSFSQSRAFVRKYRPLADSLSAEYNIPTAVMLGVSIIESSSGSSRNCKLLNNYFGIVGKNDLWKTKGIKTRYKQYPDAVASFTDFCRLVKKRKFYKKLKGNMNYNLWIDAISKANYSEVPDIWKQRVTAAIRKNKLSATH